MIYGSRAGADTYLSASTSWTNSSDDQKDSYLAQATRFMDGLKWRGYITSSSQELEWPRSEVYDSSGRYYASDTIPDDIVNATYEFANKLAGGESLYPDSTAQGVKRERVKAGSVESETEWHSASTPLIKWPEIGAMFERFLRTQSFICRA